MNRILLVDDDTVTNMLHRRVIERSGQALSVEVATDGQQALDVLSADMASHRPFPEVVLLDINMPGMGGFEFLENYATIPKPSAPQMIIVMLSTSLLEADQARVKADPNVYGFCEKPLRSETFMELAAIFHERNKGKMNSP
ncbi:MAG: response regulator [Sulfitobacter sp.]